MPGRKWCVLLAAFVMTYMSVGFSFSMGVMFSDILEEFNSTRSQTIAIQSTNLATSSIFCCVSGAVIHRFGPRTAGIIGTICSVLGLCVSYFATGIIYLIVSVGIVAGTGFSLLYLVAALSTNRYFTGKQNAMAVAFVISGVSTAGLTLPYLLSHFEEYYGIRGTFFLFGGICFNCLPAAFALENQSELEKNLTSEEQPECVTVSSIVRDIGQVLKCKRFVAFAIAISISISCVEQLVITVVDYTNELGFDGNTAVFLLFLMNLFNLLGRLFPGLLMQVPRVSVFAIPVLNTFVGASTMCLLPSFKAYWKFATLMCLGHFMHGGFYTIIPLSVRELLPLRLNSLAVGILFGILGILEATSGPISGNVSHSAN